MSLQKIILEQRTQSSNDLIAKIRAAAPDVEHTGGCSKQQVYEAQRELGITFPKEYVDYVMTFGTITFHGVEWTGLNIDGHCNTVYATKQEKSVNPNFPEKHFVLENVGIESVVTIVNESGQVFTLQRDRITPICNSLSEYFDNCLLTSLGKRYVK